MFAWLSVCLSLLRICLPLYLPVHLYLSFHLSLVCPMAYLCLRFVYRKLVLEIDQHVQLTLDSGTPEQLKIHV